MRGGVQGDGSRALGDVGEGVGVLMIISLERLAGKLSVVTSSKALVLSSTSLEEQVFKHKILKRT